MKLKTFSTIKCGLVISRKKALYKKETYKKYRQLNLRSINKRGYINEKDLELLYTAKKIDVDYLTHYEDIVIRLTDPFTAIYIEKRFENIVITSNFCVIRNLQNFDSSFVAEYLNSNIVMKEYISNLQGSIIKNIRMSSIGEIDIPTIDLNQQKLIGKLLMTERKKIQILEKIIYLEENRMKTAINDCKKIGEQKNE